MCQPIIPIFAVTNYYYWLIDPNKVSASTLILCSVATTAVLTAVLYQLGIIGRVIARVAMALRVIVQTGYHAWAWGLSWAPWPIHTLVQAFALTLGVWLAERVPALAVLIALVPFGSGVVACLAYMFIDAERYDVARGYKAIHNPEKGQRLAKEVMLHGHRVGVMLLAMAAGSAIGGFALLNMALFNLFGEEWYTRPIDHPGYGEFVASTLVHLLSVVDVLNLLENQHAVPLEVARPESWPAAALMGGFKLFFTFVLLQQLFSSVRRGRLLAETVSDFWSPYQPIHDRARTTLPQYGANALTPMLVSLRAVESLTREQRQRLPEVIATIGPAAVPALITRLRDRNEHVRAVAVSTLALLNAGTATRRIAQLSTDPSELVRLSVAAAMGRLAQIDLPTPNTNSRRWWARLSSWPWYWFHRSVCPTTALTDALRTGLTDPSAAVRSAAANSTGQLEPENACELATVLLEQTSDADETVRVSAIRACGNPAATHPDTIPTLTALLSDPNPVIRVATADSLGQFGENAGSAVAPLAQLLHDREEAVRTAAAKAIGRIGTLSPAAAECLVTGLTSDDTVQRARTAEVLGSIGGVSAEVIAELVAAASDPNDRVRAKAIEAIGRIGPAAAETAVPRLRAALVDEDEWVAALAAQSLGEMGQPGVTAVPDLVTALAHQNPQVRANAAGALHRFGPAAHSAQEALEKAALDRDDGVRVRAVEALASLGEPSSIALAGVRTALTAPNPRLREVAVAAFGTWGEADEQTRETLLRLLSDPTDGVKLRTLQVLPRVYGGSQEVVDGLTRRLTEDDSDAVRAEAARSLGQLGAAATTAGPTLLRAVQTGEAGVRRQAVRALVSILPPEAAEAFTAGLHDAQPAVRVFASAGWRKVDQVPQWAAAALVEGLLDPKTRVQANAAHAIGRLDSIPDAAVPLLADALKSESVGLRLNAATALHRCRSEAAVEALRPLLNDANPRLRLIAANRVLIEDPDDQTAAGAVTEVVCDRTPAIRRAVESLLATRRDARRTLVSALRTRLDHERDPYAVERLNEIIARTVPSASEPSVIELSTVAGEPGEGGQCFDGGFTTS